MNKLTLSTLLLTSIALSPFASADNHTVTLGYAQSKVQDFKDIKGVNLKYRYEWDSPLSVISAFTYMTGKEDISGLNNNAATSNTLDVNTKVKYYSLSAGPAYRINNYISAYGLLGLGYTKVDDTATWKTNSVASFRENVNSSNTSLIYGVGLQVNPIENVAIDIGYEGSKVKYAGKSYSVNGFNIGVGYRF